MTAEAIPKQRRSRWDIPEVEPALSPRQLREVAVQLRQHAGRHARTEAEMTAFLDRADEIRDEAWTLEARRKRR